MGVTEHHAEILVQLHTLHEELIRLLGGMRQLMQWEVQGCECSVDSVSGKIKPIKYENPNIGSGPFEDETSLMNCFSEV